MTSLLQWTAFFLLDLWLGEVEVMVVVAENPSNGRWILLPQAVS